MMMDANALDHELVVLLDEAVRLRQQMIDLLPRFLGPQQKVLRLRFGLDDGISRTISDVAGRTGFTAHQVTIIEKKALAALRQES